MFEYPENELIKCCEEYPRYHRVKQDGRLVTWLECPCCRRRTVNVVPGNDELTLIWNEQILHSGDPRRSLQGKCAIISLVDAHDYTHGQVAEILGMSTDATTKYISRIREEFEEIYGTIEEDQEPR